MLVLFRARSILEPKRPSRPYRTVTPSTMIYLYADFHTPSMLKSANSKACFFIQSMLPGQRLSACTCPGESHPGPVHQDGSYVGRSAPEIDLFEALVDGHRGQVSQSAQWAPFDVRSLQHKSQLSVANLFTTRIGSLCVAKYFRQSIYCRSNGDYAK
jgi:Beta-glucan synthesis-associated protein SKN1/KRE6/Sbg1